MAALSIRSRRASAGGFPLCAAAALIVACSATAPHREIVVAEQAVDRAIEADAVDHAPLELQLARDRLEKAKEAMNEEEYTEARRLAEKAAADAKLASAKSAAETAQPTKVQIEEKTVIERRY